MGMAALLVMWLVWDCIEEVWGSSREVSIVGQPAFRAYRAVGGLLLLHWCWGVSILASCGGVWTRTRINYLYLFDLDMRNMRSPLEVFNSASVETIVFFANLLLYYKVKM
ncbi:unnamed protein product, partial [Phaeothamnion confervicola]